MSDEKKVNVNEENGVELTDEQMAEVSGGVKAELNNDAKIAYARVSAGVAFALFADVENNMFSPQIVGNTEVLSPNTSFAIVEGRDANGEIIIR